MAAKSTKQKNRSKKYQAKKRASKQYFKDYYKNKKGPSVWVLVFSGQS